MEDDIFYEVIPCDQEILARQTRDQWSTLNIEEEFWVEVYNDDLSRDNQSIMRSEWIDIYTRKNYLYVQYSDLWRDFNIQ